MSFIRRSPFLLVTIVLIVAAALFAAKIHRQMVDFTVNYTAGDRLIHGETLYRTTDNHYQFKYSPFCALLYAPLSGLPIAAAKAVWYLGVILAIAGIFFFTNRILSGTVDRIQTGAIVGAGFILAKFFFREIQLGQINALITVLLLLMIAVLQKDEPSPFSGPGTNLRGGNTPPPGLSRLSSASFSVSSSPMNLPNQEEAPESGPRLAVLHEASESGQHCAVLREASSSRRSSDRHRDMIAGLFWGLAIALKPYALIFLPYFILKRRWNVLWPAIIVLGISLIAPSLFYGFSGNISVHGEWIISLSRSTQELLDSQDNVSLLALLVKWTHDRDLSKLLYAGIVFFLAGIVFLFIRRGRGLPNTVGPEAVLLLLLIPLISPLGWDYTFISAFPAVALVLQRAREFPTAGRILMGLNFAIIALSLFDVMGRRAYSIFMSASVLTLSFLVLTGYLGYLRWTRKA